MIGSCSQFYIYLMADVWTLFFIYKKEYKNKQTASRTISPFSNYSKKYENL